VSNSFVYVVDSGYTGGPLFVGTLLVGQLARRSTMKRALNSVFGAIFGLTLMVSAVAASSELVHHSTGYTSTTNPELDEPPSDNLTLAGFGFFLGLAVLLGSVLAPAIVGLVLIGWRSLPFAKRETGSLLSSENELPSAI
jgi:hypothetical protein